MKIVQIVPAPNTAITTQANGIRRHNQDLQIKTLSFHPKKPDKKQINDVKEGMAWADLVDVQYWKSGSKIREMFPAQWDRCKKILTHYNPYNLREESWSDYLQLVVVNGFQKSELPEARMIPLSIDTKFFKYSRYYTPDPVVHMAVNRIEGKKGVREVAQACREIGCKFILVGRVSSPDYMKQVREAGKGVLDFREGVSNEKLRESYYESAIHVCNSVDFFESGTMPILEAMSCGIPVLSRWIGHVPDLYNQKNMEINYNSEEDVESLKGHLTRMLSSRDYRIQMRLEGEITALTRDDVDRAKAYRALYEEVI